MPPLGRREAMTIEEKAAKFREALAYDRQPGSFLPLPSEDETVEAAVLALCLEVVGEALNGHFCKSNCEWCQRKVQLCARLTAALSPEGETKEGDG
jgi:hypothetical protein